MKFFRGVAEMVENDSGLHARDAARGIDLEDLRHVLREIEDDGDIAALSGERSSSTAAEERRSEITAESNRCNHVAGIARKDDTDGDLTVVRSVGGIKSAALIVEANVTAEMLAQGFSQSQGISERGLWSWGDVCDSIVHWAFDLEGNLFLHDATDLEL
jgi:hypothetical protein